MDILHALIVFDVLGQPSRLLVQSESEGLAAGDIACSLDLRPNTLSTHLSQLQSAGLTAPNSDGRSIR